MTKVLGFLSNTNLTNPFSLIKFIYLIVDRALARVQNFLRRSCSKNNISTLLRVKKSIFNAISILISNNKNVFYKYFLKISSSTQLIFYFKAYKNYSKHFEDRTINFQGSNVSVADLETQFQYICQGYSIDLIIKVK